MSGVSEEVILVEDALWVITRPTKKSVYDFSFTELLATRHPYQMPMSVCAVARVGAISDYDAYYADLESRGIRLIHTPDEHRRASQLPDWYPLIKDLTPKSLWFDTPPCVQAVEPELGWPIFMKGERQTNHHKKSLSVIPDRTAFAQALEAYRHDAILHWQRVVCREYINIRLVSETALDRVPSGFEFRTFWWRGELVGCGRYWWEEQYELTAAERVGALAVAGEAARRLAVPFLVIDIAQTSDGRWLVIECNDGQESGYAGVSAIGLWQRIVEIERNR